MNFEDQRSNHREFWMRMDR